MTESTVARPFIVSLALQIENLRTWCVLLLLGTLSRLLWLISNRHEIEAETTLLEWLAMFWTGIRFDSISMAYVMLPIMIASSLLVFAPTYARVVRQIRTVWLAVLVFVLAVLAFANVTYYQVYNDVFNDFMFAFFDGNAGTIMASATSEHELLPKLLICACFSVLVIWSYRRWIDQPVAISPRWRQRLASKPMQIACTAVIVAVVGVAIRGSIGSRPLQTVDSGVTRCRVLNLGSLSPLYNLRTAWMEHRRSSDYFDDGRLVPEKKLLADAALIAQMTGLGSDPNEFDEPTQFDFPTWKRTAAGPPNAPPKHVFVLFMESYDSWPFLDEYRELQLVANGKRLAQAGHHLKTFLPGGNSSVRSGLVALQGLFQTSECRQQRLPTSLVQVFGQLGYRTRCINGFSSEWGDAQRIALEQGFDETYYTAEIKPGGETSGMEVYDRTLFEFTSEKLDYDQPTFNFVRTTSYHTPFVVDVEAEGCAVGPFPEHIRRPGMFDEEKLRHAYGHLKYSDKVMGEFVDRMIARYPDSLFVITGDHYGRRFLSPQIPLYESSSVPLILYGPKVLRGTRLPENMAASQLDLVPTLAELCAPAGFQYVALGKSVFKPCPQPAGVGENFVIFPHAIVSLADQGYCSKLPWQPRPLSEDEKAQAIARAKQLHDAYYEVSYMLARRSLESGAGELAAGHGHAAKIAERPLADAAPQR